LKDYNQTQNTYSMSNSLQIKLQLQTSRTLHVVQFNVHFKLDLFNHPSSISSLILHVFIKSLCIKVICANNLSLIWWIQHPLILWSQPPLFIPLLYSFPSGLKIWKNHGKRQLVQDIGQYLYIMIIPSIT